LVGLQSAKWRVAFGMTPETASRKDPAAAAVRISFGLNRQILTIILHRIPEG
jgi:hypothetical protein